MVVRFKQGSHLPLIHFCVVVCGVFLFSNSLLPHDSHRCPNVTAPPTTEDRYTAPNFPTPTTGVVIYANAAAAAGGDGSAAKPFSSLEAAVAAAARAASKNTTIVLRAGTYYTRGIVLSHLHSGLTIQNYQGEDVAVSGAVPVPASKAKWAVHNPATNTWRLDLSGWSDLPAETFGMRVRNSTTHTINAAVRARCVE